MRTACVLLALMSTALYGADVYRSTDANGVVSYSDRPQGSDAEFVFVATPRSARSTARAPASPEGGATPPDQAADAPAAGEPVPQSEAERAETRAKNCATARDRVQAYAASSRLYRTAENGEREYLSSDEIDEARGRAAADVETWCN